MINDNSISKEYQNALNIMIQGNDFLAKMITSFIGDMPKKVKELIFDSTSYKSKQSCKGDKNKIAWDLYRYEDGTLWIAKCKRSGQIKRDIAHLTVRKVFNFDLNETMFFDNRLVKIGELNLFLYRNENNADEYPLQVKFEFCVGRHRGKLALKIRCNNVNCGIDYAEILKKYECFDVIKEISEKVYPIDIDLLLNSQLVVENTKPIKK